ncbi:ABC transporter permease [Paenibacillus sp. FSL R7-0297]|uniref:ABC transporter permease n=2 Tax=Paenibacillus sp. FSL R7-0297 TaxID=2921680 RepID=UPI0030F8253A
MESVQKKGYVIHKLEPAPIHSVKPEKMQKEPVIVDEEGMKRRTQRIIGIGRLTVGLLIVLCWELFTRIGWMDSYYWSSPVRILSTTWTQMTQGTLLEDIAYTSSSTVLGFIGGTLIGSLLGLSFWWSRRFAGISEPFLILLNAMPKLALAPVLVILLGIGFFSKVALAFAMTVVVAALSAHSGVQSVDKDMEKLMYSLGAKRHQVFTKVVIPWAMPWMISSLRINIALSLTGAIVGEFIASSHGIGRMVIYAGTILDINLVWVGVVVLSALSMVMYAGVVLLEKWLSKGYGMKKA